MILSGLALCAIELSLVDSTLVYAVLELNLVR